MLDKEKYSILYLEEKERYKSLPISKYCTFPLSQEFSEENVKNRSIVQNAVYFDVGMRQ